MEDAGSTLKEELVHDHPWPTRGRARQAIFELDVLAPEEKALLQDTAVLGRVFWAGALAHVTNLDRREVEQRLHALERREFVRRERRGSVAGETAAAKLSAFQFTLESGDGPETA